MNRNRVIQVLAIIALLACLLGSAFLVGPINTQRRLLQIGVPPEESDAMPPTIALTSAALGSFRGVLVDYLWYRANQLKDQGKYYEANTLSEFITTLQPRFPQVWAFHAWNMAYNISVETNTPQERWDWVNKGIALLRDKGIQYNPRAVRLYRELSWIFFHKIGQYSDEVQWYYKRKLAQEWQEILGAPNEGATTEQVIEAFKPIADAPDSLAKVVQDHPNVQPLLDQIRKLGLEPDESLLRQIGRVAMYNYSPDAKMLGIKIENLPLGLTPGLLPLLQDPQYSAAFDPLLAYMRKSVLMKHYHMDPQEMLNLLENYGPLDWRDSSAHAHYWADMGTKLANERLNPKDSDLINTYRQRLHSIQDLMRGGRMVFDPITGHLDLLPDPRFIDIYEKVLEIAKDEVRRTGQSPFIIETTYDAGYENFLLQAITFTYLYGDTAKAQAYYQKARDLFANSPSNRGNGRYEGTIEDLVSQQLMDQRTGMISYSVQFIDAEINRGVNRGLYNGDPVVFSHFLALAKKGYDEYKKKAAGGSPIADQSRMGLLPFDEFLADSYIKIMQSREYSVLDRARIWRNTPLALRLASYSRLREFFRTQAAAQNFDPERMFPVPEGWKPPASQPATEPSNPVEIEHH